MSSTKSQVAIATTIPNLPTSQSQKDYSTEEPLGRQNSFGSNRRGNMKGKHLTRSHAMRESTSPPRTPTPRADHVSASSPNGQITNYQNHIYQQHLDANDNNVSINNNNNKLHAQSTTNRGNSPITEAPVVIVTSQHKQQQNVAALCNEAEFPKLTPPKSNKSNMPINNAIGGGGGGNNQQQQVRSSSNISTISNESKSESNSIINNNNNNHNHNSNNNNNHNSNSGNNNNNGNCYKKLIVDIKTNTNVGAHETHKHTIHNNNHSNNSNNNNNCSKQNAQLQPQYNAGNAFHQALNVAENQQQQITSQSPSPIGTVYNSPMNYQLNENAAPQQSQQQHNSYEKENRCPRNESQSSNISTSYEEDSQMQQQNYDRSTSGNGNGSVSGGGGGGSGGGGGGGGGGCSGNGNGCNNGNKKHRTTSNSKGTKPRLKNIGCSSSGSIDTTPNSNNTSGFISRVFNNSENSNEQFTDYGGTDLLSFFKETLNRTSKDRIFLLKTEKELIDLVQDKSRSEFRFPANSSYNRMLLHRTAAFFGMEHNVDSESQQCVIVNVTKNTRIPDVRFKSLVRDHREDTRKSILKRDTHSFDEPRQSSYLCPDRGMLDRKAKSFEEREEDYERARSRIFSRTFNDCGDSVDDNFTNITWTSSMEQQQHHHQQQQQQQQTPPPQQQQQRSRNPNGKISKMQNSSENRDIRTSGTVSKAHSFGGYGGPPSSGGPSSLRGDSTNCNKNGNARCYSKQEAANSNNTQWRLSPSNNGSIYHFDPSNLPPSQAINTGIYQPAQTISSSYSPHHQQHSASQQKNKAKIHPAKNVQQQQHEPTKSLVTNSIDDETCSQTVDADSVNESLEITLNDAEPDHGAGGDMSYIENESSNLLSTDECDNVTNCLSVTTTTHTKNYDRIEVQKFKHQATSPNIPSDREDASNRENSTSSDGSELREQAPSRNQQPSGPTAHSARSTPFSSADSNTKQGAGSEESKATTWTYTTSYQAPDGSTVFHTTTTPNGNPYCTASYQQAPDGSIYAVPQGMVYAYPQPVEGEVQGFLMPVFDANTQRSDGTSLISTGTQAIYPANGGATAMMPIATAYPTAQFASAAGTPIYPTGQVIYTSDQFAPSGGTLTAAAAPSNSQLQQIPMTTYPIGYPYPYGYWGQNITYYVPQQTINNAVATTPLLPAPTQAPPATAATGGTMSGAHVAGGVTITNLNSTAAGPSANTQMSLASGNVGINGGNGHTAYQAVSGTTYFGTGRIKRPTTSHFANAQQSGHHHQIVATIPGSGGATATYQLGHAVPTLTLATPGSAVGGTNDLNTGNAPNAAPMYALPQHAAIFPANVYSYAASGASTTAGLPSQVHTTANALTPAAVPSSATHAPQSSAVISNTPYYTSHPQIHAQAPIATLHTPGPAAIPIVDPATLSTAQVASNNSSASTYGSHSTPSTPHSLPTQIMPQRNPPLFSTPPIVTNTGNGTLYSNSSTPHYYANTGPNEHQQTVSSGIVNNPQSNYVVSTYDKRNNSNIAKKSSSYSGNNNMVRQTSTNNYITHNGSGKPPLLSVVETPRASPNTNNNSYHHQNPRPHLINKRNNEKSSQQVPLLSGPFASTSSNSSNYHTTHNHAITGDIINNKPPIRLNAAAASFRQKSATASGGSTDYRRSMSQRNSPATNSSSNDTSNNNSPNSIAGTSSNSAATTPNTPLGTTFLSNGGPIYNSNSNEQQHQPQTTSALYIQRGSYIPATIHQHNNLGAGAAAVAGANVAAGSQQTTTATVLSSTVAATATLGAYNPAAASGVYFKYGQTYFAHPSVALPNSRRSPSTDIRPPMAQMAGMYPTVNMMIPAPPRHAQGRHPNPNYRGTRPPR